MTTAAPRDKRHARSERTRLKLLEAAMACYRRSGAGNTSMDEVAQTAGVGRATLYRHFANHESLLSEVMAHNLREIQAVIATSVRHCDRAEDYFVESALVIIRECNDRELGPLIFGEGASGAAASRISFSDPVITRMGEELLEPFYRSAKREGILRDWVTRPLLLEWTSRLMLSFIATPSPTLNSLTSMRRFFRGAVLPSIIEC